MGTDVSASLLFDIRNEHGQLITSLNDWFHLAPPKKGALQWKDFRSAKELARSFLRSGRPSPPTELLGLLRHCFGQELRIEKAIPECCIRLDDFRGEPRNCDLIMFGQIASARFVANIEAKADEPFGELTGDYYDRKLRTTSNVPRRIENLASTLFGRLDDEIRCLRYQLLHATVATILSAQAYSADKALFLVYEFTSSKLKSENIARNRRDWANFVRALAGKSAPKLIEENQIIGPVHLPNLTTPSLYLGHLATALSAEAENKKA